MVGEVQTWKSIKTNKLSTSETIGTNALARLVFRNTDFGMVLEHTEVDASLAGQGIGRALVKYAVEVARNEKFQLAVECEYAQAEFKNIPTTKMFYTKG